MKKAEKDQSEHDAFMKSKKPSDAALCAGEKIVEKQELSDERGFGALNSQEIAPLIQESIDAELKHSKNLLARIHRDGGNYTAKHGIEKSCHDAESAVVRLRMDAKLMADALQSLGEGGFSFGIAVQAAIHRGLK